MEPHTFLRLNIKINLIQQQNMVCLFCNLRHTFGKIMWGYICKRRRMRDGHMSLIRQCNDQSNRWHAFCSSKIILIWWLHVLIAAPYYTIQPDGQTDMALCHNFHSSVFALMEWKLQNPSRCLSKGCPWAECFMRWTFGPQQSADLQQH